MDPKRFENTYTYHAPKGDQTARYEKLRDKARELDMDFQLEAMAGHSGTNGWPLQVSREGVATAVLSLPLRYMHTPVETVNCRDLEATAELLAAFIRGIGREVPSYA